MSKDMFNSIAALRKNMVFWQVYQSIPHKHAIEQPGGHYCLKKGMWQDQDKEDYPSVLSERRCAHLEPKQTVAGLLAPG